MNKQSGGTILGFVMGLVVGLGVALAVAVYITKVPVQFLSKGQTRTSDQDAAETKKNKDWDPNAALSGKNPAKAATPAASAPDSASVAAPSGAPAPALASTPTSTSVPAPIAVTKREPKPVVSADPLGDLANARSAAASNEPFIYFVQIDAFRAPEAAESLRAKLALNGVEAKVTEREQSGRTVYRVRVGPFDRKEDAEKAKQKLDTPEHETALVRVQR